ncbi:MAG: LCP family protein [Dehalococcoidia bacterium]|nr:LCP family protein [Dehalococcoidia bacterium]
MSWQTDLKLNFDIEIDNYVIMDFDGVSELIDAIGGVDVTIPEDLAVYDWWYSDESGRRPPEYLSFPPGETHLNGYEAVAFGRNRSPSDLERIERQQLVLQAAASQAFNIGLLRDPMGAYDAYKDVVKHDFSAGQIPASRTWCVRRRDR